MSCATRKVNTMRQCVRSVSELFILIILQHNYELLDPVLTQNGKEQCRLLKSTFTHHNDVDIVISSPLRRTIQTTALSFGPALSRKGVPFMLLPILQEIGDMDSDKGIADTADDIKRLLPDLFAEGEVDFDISTIDASAVTNGWNDKVSLDTPSC